MKTFKQWQDIGYGVIKGEKSKHRNNEGDAVFTDEQVVLLPIFKNEDELRWENNVAVQEMIRERSMCGDKFAAMCVDLDRFGEPFGISDTINYGDNYDACDDMEAF